MAAQARSPSPPPSRERAPDFTGLFGIAFLLLVLGIVFYLNQNLLSQLGQWWDQIVAGRILFRPPEGIIRSAVLFFAFLGGTNFVMAALRWSVTGSKIRTLSATLGGFAMIGLGYLLYRYSLRDVSGPFVLSVEAGVIAILLFVFIFSGLYWTTERQRPAPQRYQAPRQW